MRLLQQGRRVRLARLEKLIKNSQIDMARRLRVLVEAQARTELAIDALLRLQQGCG